VRPRVIRRCGGIVLAALAGAATLAPSPVRTGAAPRPSVLLLTLDTTRADALGSYGAHGSEGGTPALDGLAARGVRYARALAPAPLTFPAHCSLMTGLDPPFHGVRDNGASVLAPSLPTLATVLSSRGWATAAFVSSRVLDRRFGLDRGFETYGDRMAAEREDDHGYPERDADAVTSDALAWLKRAPRGRPFLLWIHYYDPHSPYEPPGDWTGAPPARRYAGEVSHMDRAIGRLLAALPDPATTIVAAAGDHGEMLFEHGERDHGLLLYRASLEVPLILAGPGVPSGRVVSRTVGTRGLAATLLALAGAADAAAPFGPALPDLTTGNRGAVSDATSAVVYGESFLPATAYGWSPLRAASDERLRYVLAPKPELYDFVADPGETRNLAGERPADAERLRAALADVERRSAGRAAPAADPPAEVVQALRDLGYLSGSSPPPRGAGIDPKDGISMLPDFERAVRLTREGRAADALPVLEDLVRRSPGNVPFLSRLGEAQAALGRTDAAVETLRRAISLNPRLDFLHLQLANTYVAAGRVGEARAEYEAALALNPRLAKAWLSLGEIANRSGSSAEERALMKRAVDAGTSSAAILARLAQIETASGELEAAEAHAAESTDLLPEFAAGWWTWGEVAEKRGRRREAIERYEKALSLGFQDARAWLRLGGLQLADGRTDAARRTLTRAASLGGDSAVGAEARRLLARAGAASGP